MRLLLVLIFISTALAAEKPGLSAAPKKPAIENTSANDPVYIEYMRVLTLDDAAEKEIDRWIEEAEDFAKLGLTGSKLTLGPRIQQRLKEVRDAYENFLKKNPKHTDGIIAYSSFLMDIGEEDAAVVQLEKARELDPRNPSSWNNLANHFGHRGPVEKAFPYYEKAMELDPKEPVYPHNLATTTYLFRKDAQEYYKTNETGVFNLALDFYAKALKLDPTNLVIATDLAQSYYGIKPLRTNDALTAWTNALNLAKTEVEQQGIYLHLARVELNTGRFEEARNHLNLVTNTEMFDLKNRLLKNLDLKQRQAATNSPAQK